MSLWTAFWGFWIALVVIAYVAEQRRLRKRAERLYDDERRAHAVTSKQPKAAEATINECPAGCPSCVDTTDADLARRVLKVVES